MLILGLISLAIGVLVVSSSSLVLGVRHVTPEVPTIPLPTHPNPFCRPHNLPYKRSNYAQSAPGNVHGDLQPGDISGIGSNG